jgi:4-amino-4-deoxy-L-arabinose transferase-like glycosyltransferase
MNQVQAAVPLDSPTAEKGSAAIRGYTPLNPACICAALILGGASAWAARSTMFPDGVSYLDIGDAYLRGDWHNAINAYWSPLYSWIVGGFLKIFSPALANEFPLVHLVNFLIYAVALACFSFFLQAFIHYLEETDARPDESSGGLLRPPVWAFYVFGYSAFVVSSLFLITISFASGDMAVAAIIYFASALLLKIRGGHAGWLTFAALGLALGIGYYAKTAMFLMAFPFLITAAIAQYKARSTFKPAALSLLVFLLTASPLIIALSVAKGRPTFGDSGTINYTVNVGRVQFFIPHEPGTAHPVHKLISAIEAYEYAMLIRGTYPLWYDPAYWHEGIHPHFDLARQLRTIALTSAECAWISFNLFLGLPISVAIIFLYLISPSPSRCFAAMARHWILWLPALAGIGLYALVVIEPRYVAGLFCVLWMVAFAGVRLPASLSAHRLMTIAVLVVALTTCALAVREISRTARGIDIGEKNIATPECPRVAAALLETGLHPGDNIALVSDWLFPSREGAYISRLARVRIIGEARPDTFWPADDSARSQLIADFANAGAKALLTYKPPRADAGWQRLAGTDYYLYLISATPNQPTRKDAR